jgi:hypothetical protein
MIKNPVEVVFDNLRYFSLQFDYLLHLVFPTCVDHVRATQSRLEENHAF